MEETKSKFSTSPAPQVPMKMTYEEFLNWPDEDLRAEWVYGEVIKLTPVSNRHQNVADFLTALLRHFAEAHQLGEVRSAPFQMKTGPELPGREPDALFIASERLDRLKNNYLDGAADLAIEIISPESRARDRGDKFYEYEQGGVREYWLIDPIRGQAEFYRLGEDGIYHTINVDKDGIFRSEAIKGLWLKTEWLWQEPLPMLMSILKEWGLV